MKLTQSQQNTVYSLVATGSRPVEIVRQINEEYKPTKEFTKQQVNYYLKVFKSLSSDEQLCHLPYSMQESFARQEVRINTDIHQVQTTKERLAQPNLSNDEYVQLSRLLISIQNRIGQELGQVRALSKAGVGNLNLMQNVINNYNTLIKKGGLTEADTIELVQRVKKERDVIEPKD